MAGCPHQHDYRCAKQHLYDRSRPVIFQPKAIQRMLDDEMGVPYSSSKWVAVGHTVAFACADRYTPVQARCQSIDGDKEGRLHARKIPVEVCKCSNSSFLPWPYRIVFRLQLELAVSKRTKLSQRRILGRISLAFSSRMQFHS